MAKRIKLTKGYYALVSDEDYDRVRKYKWCVTIGSRTHKPYAMRTETKRVTVVTADGTIWKCTTVVKIRMHRFIVGLPPGRFDKRVVDHKNGDGLDNRRENLEVVSQEENMNRSPGWKKKGVKATST